MKKIEVKIKQKDKGFKDLSLLNLRDEVVNFLYKDTVANSTKVDLQFFIILYFILIRVGDKTFLEKILDEGMPKFSSLNSSFAKEKGYLRTRQYRKMVEEHGLSKLFENDIFFLLIESIMQVEEMQKRYASFLKEHAEVEDTIKRIATDYTPKIAKSFESFQSKRIQDDRYDEYGNYYDLSKSVYRTVRMRNVRNLDLNLQKYTSVKEITSKSPVDLTFLQHIDPQIIFDLWDKFHVAEYMKSTWDFANNTPIVSNAVGAVAGIKLLDLVNKFTTWKRTNGKINLVEKNKARREFEGSKNKNGKALEDLTLRLVDSVLKADERREKEVEELRVWVNELTSKSVVSQDKVKIKKLEERIAQLENLSVTSEIIDDKKNSENELGKE